MSAQAVRKDWLLMRHRFKSARSRFLFRTAVNCTHLHTPACLINFLFVGLCHSWETQVNELCDFGFERQFKANVWIVYEIAKALLVSKSRAHAAGEDESTHDSVFRPMTHTVISWKNSTFKMKSTQRKTSAGTWVIFVTWTCAWFYYYYN